MRRIAFLIASLIVFAGIPTGTANAAKSQISFFSPCTNNRTKQIEIYMGIQENCNISFTINGSDRAFRSIKIGWVDEEDGSIYWDDESAKSNKVGKGVIKNAFSWLMEDDGECYEGGVFDYRLLVESKGKSKSIIVAFEVLFIPDEDYCGY